MTVTVEPHRSSLGMDANIAVLIAYLGGVVVSWIPYINYVAFLVPLVIFILEKESNFVRFHAMQGFALNVLGLVLRLLVSLAVALVTPSLYLSSPGAALGIIGAIGFIGTVLSLAILVLAIIAVVNGFQYKEYRLPVLGNLAVKMVEMGEGMFHKSA